MPPVTAILLYIISLDYYYSCTHIKAGYCCCGLYRTANDDYFNYFFSPLICPTNSLNLRIIKNIQVI